VVLHRVRALHTDDGTELDRIPITTVARTLLDLAEVVPADRLARAVENAERLGLFDLIAIEELCERSRGRRGLKPLRQAIAGYVEGPVTRSDLEREFVAFCDRARLPRPAMNVWLEGFEVDALWRDSRIVVEVDSYAFHRTRAAFERDRESDADLHAAGYKVIRVTHRMIEQRPQKVAKRIRSLLLADRSPASTIPSTKA
jgi:hypothetical protein